LTAVIALFDHPHPDLPLKGGGVRKGGGEKVKTNQGSDE